MERLSSILSDLISKRYVGFNPQMGHSNLIAIPPSLPEIQTELEKATQAAWLVLRSLPTEPSKDPQNEIVNLLHNFVTDLGKHIEGVPDADGLLQAIRPAQEWFRCEIRRTAPGFFPFETQYKGKKKFGKPGFLRDEEGEDFGDEESTIDESPLAPTEEGVFWDQAESESMPVPKGSTCNDDDEEKTRSSYSLGQRDEPLICIDEVLERAHQ